MKYRLRDPEEIAVDGDIVTRVGGDPNEVAKIDEQISHYYNNLVRDHDKRKLAGFVLQEPITVLGNYMTIHRTISRYLGKSMKLKIWTIWAKGQKPVNLHPMESRPLPLP